MFAGANPYGLLMTDDEAESMTERDGAPQLDDTAVCAWRACSDDASPTVAPGGTGTEHPPAALHEDGHVWTYPTAFRGYVRSDDGTEGTHVHVCGMCGLVRAAAFGDFRLRRVVYYSRLAVHA